MGSTVLLLRTIPPGQLPPPPPRISKDSQMATVLSHHACFISHGYSSRPETLWSMNGSSLAPWGSGRERKNAFQVTQTLRFLSDTSQWLATRRKGYHEQKKHRKFTNGPITYRDRHDLGNASLRYYTKTSSLTLQKKPHCERSISSRAKAVNFRSANATVPSAKYTIQEARQRRPSNTSRHPLGPHPLSTGTISCFGIITV